MSRLRIGALLPLALLCGLLGACSGSHPRAASTTARSAAAPTAANAPRLDADEDYDDESGNHYDLDDYPILHFGHAASPVEMAEIASLARNYYADAAADDARAACGLIFSLVAEALPEQYGVKTYGRTCTAVASKLFKLKHALYVERHRTLRVTGARVEGQHGFVLLRFNTGKAYDEHLRLRREGNRWTLHQLFDEGLP